MKVYALTGGIASGKSTVTLKLRARGYVVIDADEIVRQLYGKGYSIYNAIVGTFGDDILDRSGEIDRKKLGNLIFGDREARLRLDRATHPIIEAEIQRRIDAASQMGESLVFVDSPLLIETGKRDRYDAVILVYAAAELQIQRLMARNSLSYDEALMRLQSQMPIEDKKAYADFIIDNNGEPEALEAQIECLLERLAARPSDRKTD